MFGSSARKRVSNANDCGFDNSVEGTAGALAGALVVCGGAGVAGAADGGIMGGERRFRELAAVQQTLQEEARRDWMEQDSPDAHTATHQGTFVYKRFSPLMAFDPGVEGLLGTKLRLESHQQQAMTDPLQMELIDPLQFDVSTPALLMQVVLPFFMILLTFSAVSREWEQGTLPLVLSTGQSWRVFVLGKMFAFLAMSLLVVIPLGLFLLGNLWRMHHIAGMSAGNFTLRTLSLAVCCLLYLAGWSFLSLAISARAGSSRQALIILLSLWTFVVVLVPRAAVHVAEWAAPLPSLEEVERDRQDAVEYGDNGEHAYTKLYAELEAELLRKHGVSDPEDLPLNLTGAQLLAAENLTDRIYDESRARWNGSTQPRTDLRNGLGCCPRTWRCGRLRWDCRARTACTTRHSAGRERNIVACWCGR